MPFTGLIRQNKKERTCLVSQGAPPGDAEQVLIIFLFVLLDYSVFS